MLYESFIGTRKNLRKPNQTDDHKAKAIAHMNKQEYIHIKYDTAIFLLRSLLD
jgi:hypothetical protein